jgi:hypothetical protein
MSLPIHHPSQATEMAMRIHALHSWYEGNVMRIRLTPEVERLWMQFFKAGYNGKDLAKVIRYLRNEISRNKRNNGCLSISSLLRPDDAGVLRFAIDLGLATASYGPDKKLTPLPAGESEAAPAPSPGCPSAPAEPRIPTGPTPEQRAARLADIARLKSELTGQIRDAAPLPELDH